MKYILVALIFLGTIRLHGLWSVGVLATTLPVLRISELMADPASLADSQGEWFEIVNVSNAAVDVSTWRFESDGDAGFTPSSDVDSFVEPSEYAIFCKNRQALLDKGISCQFEYGSRLNFRNTSDDISVATLDDATVGERFAYGNGLSVKSGHSFERDDFLANVEEIGNWHVSFEPINDLDYGTPGKLNSSPNQAPVIEGIQLIPNSITAGIAHEILVEAVINDPDGVDDLQSVEVDLGAIDGPADLKLEHTEGARYSASYMVNDNVKIGRYEFVISVVDSAAHAVSQLFYLQLTSPDYPENVVISEVLSHPKSDWNHDQQINSDDEWIEIFNGSGQSVDLKGWQLDDLEDAGSSLYRIEQSLIVEPEHWVVLYRTQTGIAINDSGDVVRLLAPDGELQHQVDVPKLDADQSYGSISGAFAIALKPTPGKANVFGEANDETLIIADAKKRALGTIVSVTGSVIVPIGLFDEAAFYVQDKSSGIQIRLTEDLLETDLNLFDQVTVTGELGTYYDEIVIRATRITLAGQQISIEPTLLSFGDTSKHLGMLVRALGQVTKVSGNTFYLKDESGAELKVTIPVDGGIVKPVIRKDMYANVVGVLTQRGKLSDGLPNVRLLPRFGEDLQISLLPDVLGDSVVMPQTGVGYLEAGTVLLGFGGLSLLLARRGRCLV